MVYTFSCFSGSFLFFSSLFFSTQMLTDLLKELVGRGVRIVTLDYHLKAPDFVKCGEVHFFFLDAALHLDSH